MVRWEHLFALAFTLLGLANQKKWIQGINPCIDKRSNGYKLKREGTKKSTQDLLDLLAQVSRYNIPAQHLLLDSWFSYPRVILDVLERNLNVICMLKTLPCVHYRYMDKVFNLKSLYNYIYKKPGKAKILASVIVELGKNNAGAPDNVKIVFVRDRNRSRKWLALLSTDTYLVMKRLSGSTANAGISRCSLKLQVLPQVNQGLSDAFF